MDAVQMLQADLAREVAASRAIVDAADAEGRPLSDVERIAGEKSLETITKLKVRIGEEQEKARFRAAVDDFGKFQNGVVDENPVREPAEVAVKARSLGDALIQSDGFRAWQAATKDAGKAPRFQSQPVFVPERSVRASMKSAGDPVLESDNAAVFAGGPGPLTTFAGLETPGFVQFRLTVEDLLTTVPVTVGNSVTYPIVKTRTQISSTPQTEGAAKPGGEYEFDMVTAELVTMAGWVKMSTQFIEDAPGLVAYINADLPLQIRQNVEAYITGELYDASNGSGGGGSVDGSGIAGSNGFDAILEAITAIQEAGGDPNGMLITPADWANLLTLKASGGDEHYLGGGPFSPTNNPWNLRVVITPSAETGLPLVADFGRGAKVYSRGGYSVDSTNTDQDDFIKNKFTVRAERRLVLGATYPEFFVQAEIGTS